MKKSARATAIVTVVTAVVAVTAIAGGAAFVRSETSQGSQRDSVATGSAEAGARPPVGRERSAADVRSSDSQRRPAATNVPVVATAEVQGARLDLVLYQSKGAGECLALVGEPDASPVACAGSRGDVAAGMPLVVLGQGALRGAARQNVAGSVASVWGVAPRETSELRITAPSGAVSSVAVYRGGQDRDNWTYFVGDFDLEPARVRIDAVADDGRVLASVERGGPVPTS